MTPRRVRLRDALAAGVELVIAGVVVVFGVAVSEMKCDENCVVRGFDAFLLHAEVVIAVCGFAVAGLALFLALTGRRSIPWTLVALLLNVVWAIMMPQIDASDPYSLGDPGLIAAAVAVTPAPAPHIASPSRRSAPPCNAPLPADGSAAMRAGKQERGAFACFSGVGGTVFEPSDPRADRTTAPPTAVVGTASAPARRNSNRG